MEDDSREDPLEEIKADIERLPAEKRHDALMEAFAEMLSLLSRAQILAVRAEILNFTGEHECFERGCARCELPEGGILNLIDGHLALREMKCAKRRRPDY